MEAIPSRLERWRPSLLAGRPHVRHISVAFLIEAISPPRAEVLQHAVELLQRLGAVEGRGETVTPLGAKLAKLQAGRFVAPFKLPRYSRVATVLVFGPFQRTWRWPVANATKRSVGTCDRQSAQGVW